MRFNYLAVFSIIILFFANSFAQELNFEIEVSIKETNISKTADTIPVTVKITNKAEESLITSGLNGVNFEFSECLIRSECFGTGKTYWSGWGIPNKVLMQNESIEFAVDLTENHWTDATSSYYDTKVPKNFNNVISNKAIYFQAFINIPAGYRMDETINRQIPINKSFRSNKIAIVIE